MSQIVSNCLKDSFYGAKWSGDLSLEDQVSKWPWERFKKSAGANMEVTWGSQRQDTGLSLNLHWESQMDKKVWIMSLRHSSKSHTPATTSNSSLHCPLLSLNSCLGHLATPKMEPHFKILLSALFFTTAAKGNKNSMSSEVIAKLDPVGHREGFYSMGMKMDHQASLSLEKDLASHKN